MSLNKIKVKLQLDYLNSLLICYHILNRPTKTIKNNNSDVFKNLKTTFVNKIIYRRYLHSQKVFSDDDISLYRKKLFSPQLKTINQFSKERQLSVRHTKDLLLFEKQFKPYFLKQKKQLINTLKEKQKCAEKLMHKIYSNAKKISGIKIKVYPVVDIRVIEGLSPSSFVKESGRVLYIIEQLKHVQNKSITSFNLTLVHELVSHYTVMGFRKYFTEIFGKHIYEIEEGFAKLFAKKVLEKITKKEQQYHIPSGLETLAYKVYEKNWHKLTNKNFAKWYYNCLKEIKAQI